MVKNIAHRIDLLFDSAATKRGYFAFVAMYTMAYWCESIYYTYLQVYFRQIGFSTATIGILYSLGAAITLFSQPLWGRWGDRSPVKNHILYYILAGSGITMLALGVSKSLPLILFFFSVHVFFRASQHPVEDSLSLDYFGQHQLRFGPVRGMGTFGYMIASIVIGWAMKWDVRVIFPIYFVITMISILITRHTPPIKGELKPKQKFNFSKIRNGKLLLGYMVFSFMVTVPFGFYATFFAIYLTTDLRGSFSQLGILMFTSVSAEILFLFFGEKMLKIFGMNKLLVAATLISLLRWFLTFLVTDPTAQIFVQTLHGISFIIVHFCLIKYIHQCVPPEARTSGQTIYSLITNGVGRIIPSLAGGFISAIYGIRILFLISFIIQLAALPLLAYLIIRSRGSENALHSV
jgi:PPP family 3-phenylpropionic acid transporter